MQPLQPRNRGPHPSSDKYSRLRSSKSKLRMMLGDLGIQFEGKNSRGQKVLRYYAEQGEDPVIEALVNNYGIFLKSGHSFTPTNPVLDTEWENFPLNTEKRPYYINENIPLFIYMLFNQTLRNLFKECKVIYSYREPETPVQELSYLAPRRPASKRTIETGAASSSSQDGGRHVDKKQAGVNRAGRPAPIAVPLAEQHLFMWVPAKSPSSFPGTPPSLPGTPPSLPGTLPSSPPRSSNRPLPGSPLTLDAVYAAQARAFAHHGTALPSAVPADVNTQQLPVAVRVLRS